MSSIRNCLKLFFVEKNLSKTVFPQDCAAIRYVCIISVLITSILLAWFAINYVPGAIECSNGDRNMDHFCVTQVRQFLDSISSIGPRPIGSNNGKVAIEMLKSELEAINTSSTGNLDLTFELQPFDG